jgi:hypothetical protein
MIETIIIVQQRDPAEDIPETPAQCPKCYAWVDPEKQGRAYICPDCGYEGEIEEWFEG